MLLEQINWILGYNQIRRDCSPDGSDLGGTVLILCNPDADALCAARILSYAFRADGIPYQLRPCGGYARMLQIIQRLCSFNAVGSEPPQQDDGDESSLNDENLFSNCGIRAVILLNIGATRNLHRLFFTPTAIVDKNNEETGEFRPPLLNKNFTKMYVIDSHRPFHLANVHAGLHIVLWNDYNWCLNSSIGDIPSDGDDLSGVDEDDSSEDEDSDDDGDESSGDEGSDEAEFKDDGSESDADQSSQHEVSSSTLKKREKQLNDKGQRKRIRSDDPSSDSDESSTHESHAESNDDETDARSRESSSKHEHELVNEDDESTKAHLKPKPVSVREMHRRRLEKIRIYYKEGTFYSAPIAYNVYNLLSREMRFENVGDLLWLACVGVTDAYIHNRLDLCGYAQFSTELKGHVNRVYPDYSGSEGLLRRNANIIFSESLYERAGLVDGPKTQIGLSENGRIVTQNDELRFFLLRHTNLLEAMRLSPHVCTKMELYKSSGMKKLQEMLAKMGLPLAQCQQHYAFMNPNLKRRLKENIREHAEEFSLDNVSYTGFLRVTGYKSLISASDMCYAITALLECEPSNKIIKPKVDSQSIPDTQQDEEMRLMTSFNVAYDALNANGGTLSLSGDCGGVSGYLEGSDLSTLVNGSDLSSSNGLGAGLKMALALQRTIISTAVSLVERKAIQRLTHFRYAYLNCTSQGPTGGLGHGLTFGSIKSSRNGLNADADIFHIFTKPLALTKLATFLMDMHRTNGKWAGVRASPLILMAENPQTQTYLVVGYECQEHSDKNRFGQNFVLAAKTMRGTFKFDSFDSNVVEVKATEVQKFIEQLHFVMEETK